MITKYTLPRLDTGEVDWLKIAVAVRENRYPSAQIDILKAIDASARAEEREWCLKAIDEVGDFSTVAAYEKALRSGDKP